MALILLFGFLVYLCILQPQLLTPLRKALVDLVANFLADVLEHPRVQAAAVTTLVAGMNATADQPDLPERAARIYLKLQEQNEHVSRQLGEQFPKVAGAFLAGAAAGLRKKEAHKEEKVEGNENESRSPSRLVGQWGSFFRNSNAEEKKTHDDTKSKAEAEVQENATSHFRLLSIPSFHSCPDDLDLVKDDSLVLNKDEAIKDKKES